MDEWMDGWIDGWMDGWMDVNISIYKCIKCDNIKYNVITNKQIKNTLFSDFHVASLMLLNNLQTLLILSYKPQVQKL